MLNKEQIEEFDQLVALNQKADVRENKEKILVLLREFTRRSFLWSKLIKENNISIRDHIVNDFAFLITGRKIEIPKILSPNLSANDKILLASYFNWKDSKQDLIKLGYSLPNPYIPYIEIFKLGGAFLQYEYGMLDIFPFIGIKTYPKEDYLVDTPFWSEDIVL